MADENRLMTYTWADSNISKLTQNHGMEGNRCITFRKGIDNYNLNRNTPNLTGRSNERLIIRASNYSTNYSTGPDSNNPPPTPTTQAPTPSNFIDLMRGGFEGGEPTVYAHTGWNGVPSGDWAHDHEKHQQNVKSHSVAHSTLGTIVTSFTYIAGNFTKVHGHVVPKLCAISLFYGGIYTLFNNNIGTGPGSDGYINDILCTTNTPDGSFVLVVVGKFTSWNGNSNIQNVVFLDAYGVPRAYQHAGGGYNGEVLTVTEGSSWNNIILLGGSFSHYNGNHIGAIARVNLASGTTTPYTNTFVTTSLKFPGTVREIRQVINNMWNLGNRPEYTVVGDFSVNEWESPQSIINNFCLLNWDGEIYRNANTWGSARPYFDGQVNTAWHGLPSGSSGQISICGKFNFIETRPNARYHTRNYTNGNYVDDSNGRWTNRCGYLTSDKKFQDGIPLSTWGFRFRSDGGWIGTSLEDVNHGVNWGSTAGSRFVDSFQVIVGDFTHISVKRDNVYSAESNYVGICFIHTSYNTIETRNVYGGNVSKLLPGDGIYGGSAKKVQVLRYWLNGDSSQRLFILILGSFTRFRYKGIDYPTTGIAILNHISGGGVVTISEQALTSFAPI